MFNPSLRVIIFHLFSFMYADTNSFFLTLHYDNFFIPAAGYGILLPDILYFVSGGISFRHTFLTHLKSCFWYPFIEGRVNDGLLRKENKCNRNERKAINFIAIDINLLFIYPYISFENLARRGMIELESFFSCGIVPFNFNFGI